MRCALMHRPLAAVLIAAVLLVGAVLQAGSAAASEQVSQPAPSAMRQGYDLLLDRFVTPLNPADLLRAASEEVLARVQSKESNWPDAPRLAGDREDVWSVFSGWLDQIVDLAGPEIERSAVEQAVLAAMVSSVKENHTRYMSAKQFEDHRAWTRGDVRYAGIGARLRGPTPVVVEVFEDSPALRVGLKPGDLILSVDGNPTEGLSLEAAISKIRGPEGSTVEIQVRRAGVPEPLEFIVTRQEIKLAFVGSRMLPDQIGYLQLRGFSFAGAGDEFVRRLAELDEAGARGLVIDLRGNGGGRIDVGTKLTSRFVKEGSLYEQLDRSGQRRVVNRSGEYWDRQIPIAVLVDGGTASMGEIFAQALRENGVATIIGAKTAGSVAAAQVFPLSDGSALQITVLEIISGKGTKLNGVGVEPDKSVSMSVEDLQRGIDSQLDAALTHVRDEISRRRTGHAPVAPAPLHPIAA